MSTKTNPARPCKCDRCAVEAVSIPGTRHRRCGSKDGAKPLPKHSWSKNQGRWA